MAQEEHATMFQGQGFLSLKREGGREGGREKSQGDEAADMADLPFLGLDTKEPAEVRLSTRTNQKEALGWIVYKKNMFCMLIIIIIIIILNGI
jgi:hypothetical protein